MSDNAPAKKKVTRSRNGCHNCKRVKIKCDELKPICSNCIKVKAHCDYSLKLTWGGRPFKKKRDSAELNQGTKKRKQQQHVYPMNNNNNNTNKNNASTPCHLNGLQFVVQSFNGTQQGPYASPTKTIIKQEPIEWQFESPSTMTRIESEPMSSTVSTTTNTNEIPTNNELPANNDINGDIPSTPNNFFSPSGTDLLSNNLHVNFQDISHGMESLSQALEKVTGGGSLFNLAKSEIFQSFISRSLDDPNVFTPPQPSPIDPATGSRSMGTGFSPRIVELDMDNYSADLAKIEECMPEEKGTLDIASPQKAPIRLFSRMPNSAGDSHCYEDDDDIIVNHNNNNNSTHHNYISDDMEVMMADDSYQIADNALNLIPPSLTPLPELLLQVPYYRHLLHFFINVGSAHLVPVPAYLYHENPFKVLLPQMAMEYPAVLTTLLAFSAKVKSSIIGKQDAPQTIVDQLLKRSCTELIKLLKNKDSSTSDATLATVMLLACYELFASIDLEKHRTHAVGARQIINARASLLSIQRSSTITADTPSSTLSSSTTDQTFTVSEGNVNFFLIRWFAYLDVIGALSATKSQKLYLTNLDEQGNYELANFICSINASEDPSEPKRDIDHIMGFDVRFLPYFSEITHLIRKRCYFVEEEGNDPSILPIDLIARALELRDNMVELYEMGEERRQVIVDEMIDKTARRRAQRRKLFVENGSPRSTKLTSLIEQNKILRATNKLFLDMGLINLYRRVLRIPRTSSIIQNLAVGIAKNMEENIVSQSPAEICTVFCSFSAACEILDPFYQQFFFDRFSKLSDMGHANAKKGLVIMQRCWRTGETWFDAAEELDIDVTLL